MAPDSRDLLIAIQGSFPMMVSRLIRLDLVLDFFTVWNMAAGIAVSTLLLTATLAWPQPVPGSLDVHWNEGASDCNATPQEPLQVHQYEPQTFILRQSPCADFEANFIYLLIGSDKALLFDTGPVPDPKPIPLRKPT